MSAETNRHRLQSVLTMLFCAASDAGTGQGLVWSCGVSESQWGQDILGIGQGNVYSFASMRNGLALAGT